MGMKRRFHRNEEQRGGNVKGQRQRSRHAANEARRRSHAAPTPPAKVGVPSLPRPEGGTPPHPPVGTLDMIDPPSDGLSVALARLIRERKIGRTGMYSRE